MKLFKSFSLFTATSLLTAGIPFFVMPILTHYLSPYDYGQLSLFNTYVAILIPLISLCATGLLNIEFFNKENNAFAQLFSSISIIPFITAAFFLVFIFLFKDALEHLLELSAKWILILPLVALLAIIVETYSSMLVVQKKAFHFGKISVSRVVVEVVLTLLFIIGIGMNWYGRVYSWLIALLLMSGIAIFYFKKEGWLKTNDFDISLLKQSLMYGLPLVPHVLGKFVINQSDALFIAKMVSVADVGLYRIGYQFGLIVSIFSSAFLNIYTPYLFERLANITAAKKIEIVRLSYIFIAALCGLTLLLTFGSKYIFAWLIDDRYASGIQYVFWISLSYLFWGGYLIFAGYLFYLKRTMLFAYLAIINVILNLILNYFLITKYGVIGAAYATTISFFVVFVLCVIISNRLYPMPWLFFIKKRNPNL